MPAPQTGIHGPLLLEEPLIRTPYELMRRAHRSAQRAVEKDFVVVQTQLTNLLKNLTHTDADAETAITKLDAATERMRGLKRKLDELQPSPTTPSTLKDRLAHIDASLAPSRRAAAAKTAAAMAEISQTVKHEEETSEPSEARDKLHEMSGLAEKMAQSAEEDAEDPVVNVIKHKTSTLSSTMPAEPPAADHTLDRYVVDYLLRTGRMRTAKTLAATQGIEPLVDIKLFAELMRIESALVDKHSCTEALAWCGENRGTLKKQGSNLEFILRLQEFIELCRRRDTAGAIAYARKNLSPWASTHMTELQQGMTLLAFGETTGVALYRKLYDASRWEIVRKQFRSTFLGIYSLPSQSLLALSLSAGLSSLRLPACSGAHPSPPDSTPSAAVPLIAPARNLHAILGLDSFADDEPKSDEDSEIRDPPTANVDCPTCNDDMRVLAKEVPLAHHMNSALVCYISGDVMDSENEPLAFPNGFVYSTKALTEMAKNNFDVVTCPRTNEKCAFSRLRKVYIS